MPQMAPINWLMLFMMFSMTFILFNIMNYYSFLPPTPKTSEPQKFTTSYTWKW